MKSKFQYLFKNIGLMFIGNFSSKILVFLLVPLYTTFLSTKEYGIYDLCFTTIQLLTPILSLNIADSVVRFAIDTPLDDQKRTFTLGIKSFLISSFVFSICMVIIGDCWIEEEIKKYWILIYILFIGYSLNNIIIQFVRGIEDISGISIAGALGTIAMIGFNLLFLVGLNMKLKGYFIAMILSYFLPILYLIIKDQLWKYLMIKNMFIFDNKEKGMLAYCLPLMFINLSWYINNVSDRYAVTWLCGIEANGVYSVAYKIPAILNAVQVIFIQAWQLSAVKELNKRNSELFYKATLQGCQMVIVLLCSIMILFTKIASRILFANNFYSAWYYVPFLLIYIVFNTLSGTIGGIFGALKNTKLLASSGIIGAIVNVILNFLLVYIMGPIGAALSTLVSSYIIWRIRIKALRRYTEIKINLSLHYIQFLLLMIQSVIIMTINNNLTLYLLQFICLISIAIISIIDLKTKEKKY